MTTPHTVNVKAGKGNRFALTFKGETVILSMDGFHKFTSGDILEIYDFHGLFGISVQTEEGLFNTDILDGDGKYILYKVENEDGEMLHD